MAMVKLQTMLHKFPLEMGNHQTKLLMLVFLKPVHLLLVYKVFVFMVGALCTYELYNIVDVDSVLVEVLRMRLAMEFILMEMQFVLMEVQLLLVDMVCSQHKQKYSYLG